MSKPSATSAIAASRSACFSRIDSISGVLRSATVAERQRHRRARRIARRNADRRTAPSTRLGVAGDGERAEAGRGAAQQLLEAGVLVGELQRLDQVALVRLAVDAEQADGRGDRRLRLRAAPSAAAPPASRARACRRSSRAPAPHRPAADRRAWRRAVERVERVLRLVVAERFDDRAAEKVLAAADLAQRAPALHASVVADAPRARGRAPAGRTRPAPCRARRASAATIARIGIVLEEAVGDRRAGDRSGSSSDSRIASFVRGSLKPVSSTSAR